MGKPSVFSRDYERKMRQRRRRRFTFSVLGIVIILLVYMKINISDISINNFKNKIQAWIDEDDFKKGEVLVDNPSEEGEVDTIIEDTKQPKIKTMEIKINDATTLQMEYEEINGQNKFKEIKDAPSNVYYSINENKNLILTIDEKQDMKIFSIDGKENSITKDTYVAPNGEVFNKEQVLQIYNSYLWNVEARFISDTRIAYISNVPYFGYDLNKYIWIVDLNDNNHLTLWNSKGKEIKFGGLKEKGLEVIIDGNVKYVNINGELIS